jgi:hypothetical protein
MMPLPHRSRFVGTGLDVTIALPVRPWRPSSPTIGGREISAAGVPASYIVRRDNVLLMRLRFEEQDWPDVLSVLEYGQSDRVLTWYPDAGEATSHEVYLEHPAAGEDILPERQTEGADWVLELDIALRSVDGSSLWQAYFRAAS